MNELIQITSMAINEENTLTVNARELHSLLEVGKHFRTWIQDRIAKYEFIEGQDYVTIESLSRPDLGTAKSRAQITKEYHISTDMAKELSMVENNEMGKQARKYFIEAEKALRMTTNGTVHLTTEQQLAQAVILANDVIKEQLLLIEEIKPKAELYDIFMGYPDELKLSVAAKIIHEKTGKGVVSLNRELIARGILFRQGKDLLPSQPLMAKGYFTLNYVEVGGLAKKVPQTMFTKPGLEWFIKEREKKPLSITK